MKIKEKSAIVKKMNKNEETVDEHVRKFVDSFGKAAKKFNDLLAHPWTRVSEIGGEQCLHKTCVGCKNGTCTGVHVLSCPCRSCSPRYL